MRQPLLRRLLVTLVATALLTSLGSAVPAAAEVENGVRPPYLYKPVVTGNTVSLGWLDWAYNEQAFMVFRRGANGSWNHIASVNTPDQPGYRFDMSLTDPVQGSGHGQCYMITAVIWGGGYGQSDEKCTAFNPAVPEASVEWVSVNYHNEIYSGQDWGFWNVHEDVNQYFYLGYQNREYGINLGWVPHNIGATSWMIKAQGLADGATVPNKHPVALRSAGAGKWLRYGVRDYGVNLEWSNTPAYEWEIIRPADNTSFALYNRVTGNYLVFKPQTYGISLGWYY
jgi:hypothetical protein